jgi:hypothetical protein
MKQIIYMSLTSQMIVQPQTENRLSVFENRVLRRIFRPKRDEVIGGWRNLQNGELHILYLWPSMIKMIMSRKVEWEGHVTCGEIRNAYKILVRKPRGDH